MPNRTAFQEYKSWYLTRNTLVDGSEVLSGSSSTEVRDPHVVSLYEDRVQEKGAARRWIKCSGVGDAKTYTR